MISFSQPFTPKKSIELVNQALVSRHQQGDGPFSKEACSRISNLSGGGHALLTPSCTAALEMASMLIGINHGDEVIMPSYTFTSAATAVTKFGGVPVFVDIEPKTGCIDADLIQGAITKKTKAISWVNYAGNVPNLNEISRISKQFNLFLIEDNAHGFGGEFQERRLGSFGHCSTLSFHATKNIQCGEGGAIVINDSELTDKAEIIREKGTNRKAFLIGDVQKYQWVDKGSSYLLAEVLAAQLLGQLSEFEAIQRNREEVWDYYNNELQETILQHESQILIPNARNIAHMFAIVFRDQQSRNQLINQLSAKGIQVNSHYQPLHNSLAGEKFGRAVGNFPVTTRFAEQLARLPLWSQEENKYMETVVTGVIEALA